ncbi:uncharacterized protein EI90DRAFT_3139796 [Cantharellus anzutake]|uniref:uncharacterized protein n=1 Tax=Cantharellus anzutake TaxID=1750568 RepID=UPI001907FB1B|nr:uncharacterized protein EI90DRAFT_3139796 [Cantharellus anzutake]KAF8310239.1 hypothetical protein EI90DRAFT_3139796 [Cantharellus anzutake]
MPPVQPVQDEAGSNQSVTRPFEDADMKETRLLLGMSAMEPLQVANFQAYTHPLIIALWVALSSAFVQVAGFWPKPEYGWYGYLAPIPAIAAMGYPILFVIDWIQRWNFEKALRRLLLSEDILDIKSYYDKPSLFRVLIWNGRPIGYVALDAAYPDEILTNLVDEEEKLGSTSSTDPKPTPAREKAAEILKERNAQRKKRKNNDPATHAVIRHLYVDSVYHRSGIQHELIRRAVNEVFGHTSPKQQKGSTVQEVFVRISSLEKEKAKVLHEAGFVPTKDRKVDVGSEPVSTRAPLWGLGLTLTGRALVGEKIEWWVLTRERWNKIAS